MKLQIPDQSQENKRQCLTKNKEADMLSEAKHTYDVSASMDMTETPDI